MMVAFSAYKKRREIAVLGIEASPGVVATKQYMYRWLNKGFNSIPGILENESAVGSDIRVNDSAIDVWHSEGPLGGKVTENGIAILNHGMFNKVTTVDNLDGTYTHSFERDQSVARKSFSIWDITPAGTHLYQSMYMDNLNLQVDVGDSGAWLEAETSFKGWKQKDVAPITPVLDTSEKEFTSRHVTVLLGDTPADFVNPTARVRARSISLALEETANVDHSVGEVNDDPEFDFDPQEAKGTMVVKYTKTDFDEAYFANKIHALKILIVNGTSSIEYVGTKVRFREVTPSDGINDTVTQTISFHFEADHENGGKDIVSTVTNTLESVTV
ncbi:hypothetical protein KRR55_06060 [Paeniglutamicibacter sp. ABSL32-1]|uniref:hypothetical protein n=1 Tax=Paeniglutamicibacter quisquiliarum TaxID=2849498 RepID=UPI001C2D91BF|nr:hypothetical protein [Paeniglutamicibacter quisquiliarum]MBV1778676.1 hypothetical protein [Paeniglutamicibacter quisquiliarum]